MEQTKRRLPVGAEAQAGGGVHLRVWARACASVEAVIGFPSGREVIVELHREGNGYFSGMAPGAGDGALYRFRLDGGFAYPDPASRFQPDGPLGPSMIIDPGKFAWTDSEWPGLKLERQVIYEMHIGTFTPEGTCASAARELPALADLGVTVVELMPIADFAGRFGWGYDGVDLFAPTRLYGGPDDLRRFVDTAHSLGVGVILDVVYNHVGPVGNFLKKFSPGYFTDRYDNEWGEALNFDGEDSGPVREYFIGNAGYWIDEYHMDGLRLDAVHSIHDTSKDHFLAALTRRAREAAGRRNIIITAEHEAQDVRLITPPEEGGYGLDALWNDDFHHLGMVAATGQNRAYYTDYLGKPQEFVSSVKHGYLYQGQRYKWQKKRRGTPALHFPGRRFVLYLQNHDQVSNTLRGRRLHLLTSPGRYRALTALLLLAPGTPMLFQGQEFAASSPFLFFADVGEELAGKIKSGRIRFLGQFPDLARPETRPFFHDPSDPEVFGKCKLDLSEREKHPEAYNLHRDLLRLRRDDPVFNRQSGDIDGAVLGPEAFVLRYFGGRAGDRLLLVNLGLDLRLDTVPEPLLAPPAVGRWELRWSSEHPIYGGTGTPQVEGEEIWFIPGHAAVVMTSTGRVKREP